MKKRCKKCGLEKDIEEFNIDKSKKDGHKNICKKCMSVKKYYTTDIDKNIKQSIRYCLKYDGPFRWNEILGFSKQELKNHLQSMFKKDMNFSNYGTVWGVSFIIPKRCYRFNSMKSDEFKKFWTLKNIKPEYIDICKKQKAEIDLNEVNKYELWDILPCGNMTLNESIFNVIF